MNDEDFARQAFATAFTAGVMSEPATIPDAEALAFRGRRAARNRRGIYAAGTTALAGVVTAGVASGPTLLNLGGGSVTGIGAGAQPTSTPPSPSKTVDAKPSLGVACSSPPSIDWAAVIGGALPSGTRAIADRAANCLTMPDGARSVEALFKLSTPEGELQVQVYSGGNLATKLNLQTRPKLPSASGSPESGWRAGSPVTGSAEGAASASSPSLDPSALASLQAMKRAIAGKEAAGSGSPGTSHSPGPGGEVAAQPVCHSIAVNVNVCVMTVTKGGFVIATDVQLLRSGASPVAVDVAASFGKEGVTLAPGAKPPLNDAQVTGIAQAVAAHF